MNQNSKPDMVGKADRQIDTLTLIMPPLLALTLASAICQWDHMCDQY